MGMTVSESLALFAILTIGDGLVAQIPALLIAITAGMVVTRQPSDDGGNLGSDIAGQLTSQPRALATGAGLLAVFSLIPGFPTVILLILAGALGAGAWMSAQHNGNRTMDGTSVALPDFSPGVRLLVARDLEVLTAEASFTDALGALPRVVGDELGIALPDIRVSVDEAMSDGTFVVHVLDVEVGSGAVLPGHVLVNGSPARLEACGVALTAHPCDGAALWAPSARAEGLAALGLRCHSAEDLIMLRLSQVLRQQGARFVGIQETRNLLDGICLSHPELVREVLRNVPLPQLAQVLKRLVAEQVSIRQLRSVLEAVAQFGPVEQDPVLLAEYVRTSLKSYITPRFVAGGNRLPAIVLGEAVEAAVRQAVKRSAAGSYLAMPPEQARYIVETVQSAIEAARDESVSLVTAMDIRPFVRRLFEKESIEVPVLSYQELTSDVRLERLAEVR